jgi:hypothetical protein
MTTSRKVSLATVFGSVVFLLMDGSVWRSAGVYRGVRHRVSPHGGIGVLYVMAYIKNAGKPKEKASNTPHRLGALLLPVRQFIMVEKDRVGAQNVLTFSMLTNMPWPVWSLVNRVPWEVAVIVHPCAS